MSFCLPNNYLISKLIVDGALYEKIIRKIFSREILRY